MISSIATPTSNQQCPSSLLEWQDDDFTSSSSSSFHASNNVNWFHERWIRLGSSNDLLMYIQDGDSSDYVLGLFASTWLAGLVLLIWTLLIFMYSCSTRKRLPKTNDIFKDVGENEILLEYQEDEEEYKYYGRPFVKALPPKEPKRPTEDASVQQQQRQQDQEAAPQNKKLLEQQMRDYHRDFRNYQNDLLDWRWERSAYKRKIACSRITVVVGCFIIIIASTLFYVNGVNRLNQLAVDSKSTLEKVLTGTQEEMERIQSFLEYSRTSNIAIILEETNTYCPVVQERICDDPLNQINCNWSGIPYGASIRSWTSTLIHYQRDISLQMVQFQHDLGDGIEEMGSWIQSIKHMEWAVIISTVFVFLLDALCVCILLGVAAAWSKQRWYPQFFLWIRSFCLIPFFVAVVAFCWMFASAFVLASLTTSDFCFNGPTETIHALLMERSDSMSPIMADLIQHYITSCTNVFVPNVFTSDIYQLVKSAKDVNVMQQGLAQLSEVDDLSDVCGPFSANVLLGSSSMAETELCSAASMLHTTRTKLSCSSWSPLYTNMVHDVLCNNVMDAFAWITISQCAIVLASMLVLTFRVAILPVNYVQWLPNRAKAMSKKVGADLRKLSKLPQAIPIKATKVQPVHELEHAKSDNDTVDSLSHRSTAETSVGNSSLLILPSSRRMRTAPDISPKMLDDEDSIQSTSGFRRAALSKTLIVANHQKAALLQSRPALYQEEHDTSKNSHQESLLLHVKGMSSQESVSSGSASIISTSNLDPGGALSLEHGLSNGKKDCNDGNNCEVQLLLMENDASSQHQSHNDGSSYEEVTVRSDSDLEEDVLEVWSIDASNRSPSYSGRSQSGRNSFSAHSRPSGLFVANLADVAEERSSTKKKVSPKPASVLDGAPTRVRRFPPGNAFMDQLITDRKSKEQKSPKSEPSTKPPGHISLKVDDGKLDFGAVTTSSLGEAMEDSIVRANNAVHCLSTKEPSELDMSSPTATSKMKVEAENQQGPIQSVGQKERSRKTFNARRSGSFARSLNSAESPRLKREDSCHFSLKLDMDTFHCTDLGDLSGSEEGAGSSESVDYEIIDEDAWCMNFSVGSEDPIFTSENTDETRDYLHGMASAHIPVATNVGKVEPSNLQLNGMIPTNNTSQDADEDMHGTSALQAQPNTNGGDRIEPPSQIDMRALQSRISSIRSLGSSSIGRRNGSLSDQHRSAMDRLNRVESIRSMMSGHSIAISAASASEGHYCLDDDFGGSSGDTLGNAILPSRAIDSEMLAVVDETWTEDLKDEEGSSGISAQAQMRNLVKNMQPQPAQHQQPTQNRQYRGPPTGLLLHGHQADSMNSLGSNLTDDLETRDLARPVQLQQRSRPPPRQILAQRRADSMRSLGSSLSDMLTRPGSSEQANLLEESETEPKKPQSEQSLMSGHSIAISASTASEGHYCLDDDLGGSSGDTLGKIILPSRAIDSEMLAVVDETWVEDLQEGETPSCISGEGQMINLVKNMQPPAYSRPPTKQIIFHSHRESVCSLGYGHNSMSASLSDDSFEIPKKPQSGISLASGHSIAISAATANEAQYYLDGDLGDSSGDTFANIMLPSRTIDSEMLAVVGETWADDMQDMKSHPIQHSDRT